MLPDIIKYITPYIINLWNWTYLLVFISVILETLIWIGFIFPWTTIIVIISFFSLKSWLNLKTIFLFAFLWTLIWNIINYNLGVKYSKKSLNKNHQIFNSKLFEKTKKIIDNNPIKAIILWRLTPWLKESIPFVSGVIGINFYKFIFYIILWTIIWWLAFIWIPYLFSYSLEIAQLWLDRFSYFILILLLIWIFFSIFQFFILKYWKNILKFSSETLLIILNIFLKQENIEKFIEKHPKIIQFIKNRFKKDEFNWLPFTILSILIIYTIFAFLWLIEGILKAELIVWLDIRLASFFYAFRNDFLVNIFLWISYLGREYIIIWFFIFISFYLFFINKKNEIISLIISILWSIWFWSLLKILFHHKRPEYWVYIENSFSFPSNHAIIAVTFYGFLFWLLIRKTKKWKTKINYLFTGLILIFLIWFSRLYLWVHYLSDVLWWYLIWILWLLFAIWLTEFLNIRYKNSIYNKIKLKKITIKILILLISIIYFISYNILYPYKVVNSYSNNTKEINISQINDVFKNTYLNYTQTFLWNPTENINFIFFAKDDKNIINIFNKWNWNHSDKFNYNSLKMIWNNLLFQKPYDEAPMTPIFWNNKTQDFSFQKLPNDKDIRYRHHIRIWKTNYKYSDYNIYVGVWVFDDWLKWHITHKIDPDINKEREYIFSSLKETWLIKEVLKINLIKEYRWENIYWDDFYSDWNAYLIRLK